MIKAKLPYALTFLSGLLLGWLALGWWLWPVAYVGEAYTYELNQADKLRYAQGAVDEFTLTGQVDPEWFSGWTGDEIKSELEQVVQQQNRANSTRAMAEKMGLLLGWRVNINPTPVPLAVKLERGTANQVGEANSDHLAIVGIVFIALLVAGIGFWLIWRTGQTRARFEVRRDFPQPQRYAAMTTIDYVPTQPKPTHTLAQSRLDFGPGLPTDQHFPIEREGTSLGEFGVNQVDDQPAWDVWLFDQRAIVTVTKVLADRKSDELASRGEVIGWDGPFLLETPNLKMTGKASMVEAGLRVELTVEAKDEN